MVEALVSEHKHFPGKPPCILRRESSAFTCGPPLNCSYRCMYAFNMDDIIHAECMYAFSMDDIIHANTKADITRSHCTVPDPCYTNTP